MVTSLQQALRPPLIDTLTRVDETLLVDRLRPGDQSACAGLVHACGGRLLSVAMRIMRDDDEARDCLQDDLLSAFPAIQTFRGPSKPGTWLHRIVVNSCLTRLRSHNRRQGCMAADLRSGRFDGHSFTIGVSRAIPPTPAEILQGAEARMQVQEAIDRLPDASRAATPDLPEGLKRFILAGGLAR